MKRDPSRNVVEQWVILLTFVVMYIGLAWTAVAGEEAAPPPGEDGADWPMWGHDPGHTFASPDKTLKPPYREIWKWKEIDCDRGGYSGLAGHDVLGYVVYRGAVYVFDQRSRIVALDTKDGRMLWRSAEPVVTDFSLAAGQGLVLAVGQESGKGGALQGFDAATGTPRWKFLPAPEEGFREEMPQTEGMVPAHPVVAHGLCYLVGRNKTVFAVKLTDGSLKWKHPVEEGKIWSVPALEGENLYFVARSDDKHELCCLSAKDGRLLWKTPVDLSLNHWVPIGLACSEGNVYLAGSSGSEKHPPRLLCCRASDGKTVWAKVLRPSEKVYGLAIGDGRLFCGGMILDAKTGQSKAEAPWLVEEIWMPLDFCVYFNGYFQLKPVPAHKILLDGKTAQSVPMDLKEHDQVVGFGPVAGGQGYVTTFKSYVVAVGPR